MTEGETCSSGPSASTSALIRTNLARRSRGRCSHILGQDQQLAAVGHQSAAVWAVAEPANGRCSLLHRPGVDLAPVLITPIISTTLHFGEGSTSRRPSG